MKKPARFQILEFSEFEAEWAIDCIVFSVGFRVLEPNSQKPQRFFSRLKNLKVFLKT